MNEAPDNDAWIGLEQAIHDLANSFTQDRDDDDTNDAGMVLLQGFAEAAEGLSRLQDGFKQNMKDNPCASELEEEYQTIRKALTRINVVTATRWQEALMLAKADATLDKLDDTREETGEGMRAISLSIETLYQAVDELRTYVYALPKGQAPTTNGNGSSKSSPKRHKNQVGKPVFTDQVILAARKRYAANPEHGAIAKLHRELAPKNSYEAFHAAVHNKSYKHLPSVEQIRNQEEER